MPGQKLIPSCPLHQKSGITIPPKKEQGIKKTFGWRKLVGTLTKWAQRSPTPTHPTSFAGTEVELESNTTPLWRSAERIGNGDWTWTKGYALHDWSRIFRGRIMFRIFLVTFFLLWLHQCSLEAPGVFTMAFRSRWLSGCHFLCSVVVMSYGDAQSWQQALFWLLEDGCLRLSTTWGTWLWGNGNFGESCPHIIGLWHRGWFSASLVWKETSGCCFSCPRSFGPKEANVNDWTGKATSYPGLALLKHGGWGEHEVLGSFSTKCLIPPSLKWSFYHEWTARISPFQTSFRFLSSNSSTVRKLRLRNIRSLVGPLDPHDPTKPTIVTSILWHGPTVACLAAGTWPTGCLRQTNLRPQWSMRWMNPCRRSSEMHPDTGLWRDPSIWH